MKFLKHPMRWHSQSPSTADTKFEAALEAYRRGNYERALALYEVCLDLDPHHTPARVNYAGTLMALGRHSDALPTLRALFDAYPNDPLLRRGMMEALRATGQWESLVEAAKRVLERYPEDRDALTYLGWATLKLGDPEGALAIFPIATEGDATYYSAWHGRGWAALHLRRLEEAIEAFSRAVAAADTTPDPPGQRFDSLFGLGSAYVQSGRARDALEVGDRMNADNRNPAATGIVRARALIALGMVQAGLTEGEFAISQGADNPYLLLDMALEYARMMDSENALRLLARVDSGTEPDTFKNYEIRCFATTVLLALGRYDEAIEVLKGLISDFGEDENLLNMLGVQYMLRGAKGDKLRAKSYFDKALQHSRDDLTLSNRAILFAEAGATREALDMTREALRMAKAAPRSPLSVWATSLNLAAYAVGQGDITGAKRLLDEMLESDSPPDWAVLGARRQLEEIEKGEIGQGPGDLPPVSGARYAELSERERRLTVELLERKVCDECEKQLAWRSCHASYTLPGLQEIGDIDVYGVFTGDGGIEVVAVGECKLRFENEGLVTHGEMSQLVDGKLKHLRTAMDESGDHRPIKGFFFANVDYDDGARKLAHTAGVALFNVKMSREWRRRNDWGLRLEQVEEGTPSPEGL